MSEEPTDPRPDLSKLTPPPATGDQPVSPPAAPRPTGSSPYDAQPFAQPYGQQPYAQQPNPQQPSSAQYAQQPYGGPYGAGHAPNPDSASARSSATLWLILNIVSVLVCLNLVGGIVGAIYAGLALGRAEADPADARRKARLAMIWFFAGLLLTVLLIVLGAVLLTSVSSSLGNPGWPPVQAAGSPTLAGDQLVC